MIAMKIITYSCLLFSGFTKHKFKSYKKRFNLNSLVEIHHLIPKQHKNHPVIQNLNYDIENGYNFIFLPNKKGYEKLNLHLNRPIHQYGHYKYNLFVKDYLDYLYKSGKYSKEDLINLNRFLRRNMRDLTIPWN
jgi:hypothetical protein